MESKAKTVTSHHEYHKIQILASDFEAGISVPNRLIHLTFCHSPLALVPGLLISSQFL